LHSDEDMEDGDEKTVSVVELSKINKQKRKDYAERKAFKVREKDIRKRFDEEDEYFSSLLKLLPKHLQSNSNNTEEVLKPNKLNKSEQIKKNPKLFGDATRAKNYGELRQRIQERLQNFDSRKKTTLSAEEKRAQKKLRKKDRKFKRKQEILQKKQENVIKLDRKLENISRPVEGSVKVTAENKPYIEKEGKMVFSKFDFSEKAEKKETKPKNYQDLLKQIKDNKSKVSGMENVKQRNEAKSEAAWDKAMGLTEGKKIKDDPERLMQTIKKKKAQKEKSKKEWDARIESQEQRKQKKQNKRDENIKKKIQDKKNKRIKKYVKHGRLIPGFS